MKQPPNKHSAESKSDLWDNCIWSGLSIFEKNFCSIINVFSAKDLMSSIFFQEWLKMAWELWKWCSIKCSHNRPIKIIWLCQP